MYRKEIMTTTMKKIKIFNSDRETNWFLTGIVLASLFYSVALVSLGVRIAIP
jgi:hypothetical protein